MDEWVRYPVQGSPTPSPEPEVPYKQKEDFSHLDYLNTNPLPSPELYTIERTSVKKKEAKKFSEPLTEAERVEFLKQRNKRIFNAYLPELHVMWPDSFPLLNHHEVRNHPRSIYKEEDSLDIEYRKDSGQICLYDTMEGLTGKVDQVDEKHFDYWEFQTALQLQQRGEDLAYLEKYVFEEMLIPMAVPEITVLMKQFQDMYGPVEFELPLAEDPYLMNYKVYKEEAVANLNSKLMLLREAVLVAGKDKVIRILDQERQEINALKATLRQENGEARGKIYDMNPYTNTSHSDWILLPRPQIPHQDNCFIRHPSLDELIEFRLPKKYKGKLFYVDGYWPSLTDYTLAYFSSTSIPTDPLKLEKQINEDTTPLPEGRVMFWHCLARRIIEEIRNFPMGVEYRKFFHSIKKKHYVAGVHFFPGMSPGKVVSKYLHEVIHSVKIPAAKNSNFIILYPSFMRGVIEKDGSTTMTIINRIWSQIIFIVKERDGEVRISDLGDFYRQYFTVSIKWENYGFLTKVELVKWCIKQWNHQEAYKVRVRGRGDHAYLNHCAEEKFDGKDL